MVGSSEHVRELRADPGAAGEGLVHRIDDKIADLPFSEMGDDQGNGAR